MQLSKINSFRRTKTNSQTQCDWILVFDLQCGTLLINPEFQSVVDERLPVGLSCPPSPYGATAWQPPCLASLIAEAGGRTWNRTRDLILIRDAL